MRVYHALISIGSLLMGASAFGGNRLNLPQVSVDVHLSGDPLQPIWDVRGDEQVLTAQSAQTLLHLLPPDFQNGCRDMVPDFGLAAGAQTRWGWSVRLLHAEGSNAERSVLLALRCTVHVPDVTFYDERLAVLLSGKRNVLKLVALDKDCPNCSDVYHLKFAERFEAADGYFAELGVEHTTDNPCCDGGDTDRGDRLLLISVPSGAKVLDFDKEAYHYSHDDEDGDTETKCSAALAYERDATMRLKAVMATTTCTENGKFKPPVTTSRYLWDERSGRFQERPIAASQ